ncbi:hypothetical protein DL770_010728 [Monosporascus sp. CRB-9-2]|nr:hypothetical protein DL770_010728 [Monosporascus sp. CRB-9-2]
MRATEAKIHRLFDEGKPFYTVGRFLDIESKLSSLDLSKVPCQVELQGIDGEPVTISVGLNRPYQPDMYPVLEFKPYQEMLRIVHHRWFDKKARDEIMCNVLLKATSPQPAASLKDAAHWEVEFSKTMDRWAKSPEHEELFSILGRCDLSSITKIICFGLGDFHRDLHSIITRSSLHHAAALTVAQQGAARFTRGFVDIGENTLVMSMFPTAPVREIIADFNFRPAVLICNRFIGHYSLVLTIKNETGRRQQQQNVMGTRHLVLVYHKGQYRIAKYGQWDGYPEGQGATVLRFVSDPESLSKLRSVLDAEGMLYEPTEDQLNAWYVEMQHASQEHYTRPPTDERELDKWCNVLHPGQDVCPSVSRDTGADILWLVADATAEKPVPVVHNIDFVADTVFCEWAYVVDLDEHVLEVYGSLKYLGTRGLPVLGDGSRFRRVESLKDAESLPSLVGRFPFDNLPSEGEFVSSLTLAEAEEELD